jgi:hypothetical protein
MREPAALPRSTRLLPVIERNLPNDLGDLRGFLPRPAMISFAKEPGGLVVDGLLGVLYHQVVDGALCCLQFQA